MGETSGGPAGHGRNEQDEDEAGNSNWVEQIADGVNGYSKAGRNDSDETLTDSNNGDDDGETVPNYGVCSAPSAPRAPRRVSLGSTREMLPAADGLRWLGSMVSILMGVCANLQVKTSKGQAGGFTQEVAMWGLGT